jgi:hypothetical protein
MHLVDNVVLCLLDLVLTLLLHQFTLRVFDVRLKSPPLHVRYVSLLLGLLDLALGVNLLIEDILDFLMLPALVNLFVDIVLPGLFVLVNTLLDVLALLPLLKFFIFVYDYVSHSVHQSLNPRSSFGHGGFALTLLLLLLLNHFLNLLGFLVLAL